MSPLRPEDLLGTIQSLLNSSGGIQSQFQVSTCARLMRKFSKKLVSRTIYANILNSTSPELREKFLIEGGWELVFSWLSGAAEAKNTPLSVKLLQLLQVCPRPPSAEYERFFSVLGDISANCSTLSASVSQLQSDWSGAPSGKISPGPSGNSKEMVASDSLVERRKVGVMYVCDPVFDIVDVHVAASHRQKNSPLRTKKQVREMKEEAEELDQGKPKKPRSVGRPKKASFISMELSRDSEASVGPLPGSVSVALLSPRNNNNKLSVTRLEVEEDQAKGPNLKRPRESEKFRDKDDVSEKESNFKRRKNDHTQKSTSKEKRITNISTNGNKDLPESRKLSAPGSGESANEKPPEPSETLKVRSTGDSLSMGPARPLGVEGAKKSVPRSDGLREVNIFEGLDQSKSSKKNMKRKLKVKPKVPCHRNDKSSPVSTVPQNSAGTERAKKCVRWSPKLVDVKLFEVDDDEIKFKKRSFEELRKTQKINEFPISKSPKSMKTEERPWPPLLALEGLQRELAMYGKDSQERRSQSQRTSQCPPLLQPLGLFGPQVLEHTQEPDVNNQQTRFLTVTTSTRKIPGQDQSGEGRLNDWSHLDWDTILRVSGVSRPPPGQSGPHGKMPCYFWGRGYCKYGDRCRFIHGCR